MNLTIITKGSYRSYHTSFKKACLVYGWDYKEAIKGGTPPIWNDYIITKEVTNVTIPEMKLIDTMVKNFKQTNSWDCDNENDFADVEWTIEDEWVIQGNISIRSERCVASTDRGDEEWTEHHYEVEEITAVFDPLGNNVLEQLSLEMIEVLIDKLETNE